MHSVWTRLRGSSERGLIEAVLAFLFIATFAQAWPGPEATALQVPVRLLAAADVEEVTFGKFSVREYLDVHNDDLNKPLLIKTVTADSWVGRRRDEQGTNWLDGESPIIIGPMQIRRVAERQRIVTGRARRNWWVRWLRFQVTTDRGVFISNFIDSPLRPPGNIESAMTAPGIDSMTAPGLKPQKPGESQKLSAGSP
ncbi:MAG: hypothetical protein HQM09_00830 [Candidatus Riflebacteria bacterium]|nr:hypothetical protein [Candidatus Riflebacteria bacterium]